MSAQVSIEYRIDRTASLPLGPRSSGVLLHVTSLPSPFGVGDVGPTALRWINQLHDAGQRWWQALPLGPTGYGDSPYQPLSTFAGNALLISPDFLVEDGLVRESDCAARALSTSCVDYASVARRKHQLLHVAWANFRHAGAGAHLRDAYQQFCQQESHWLEDYALFRALRGQFKDAHYLAWPKELVRRKPEVLDQARREFADSLDQARFAQFLLTWQGERLKRYAHLQGVRLIGDLPFYVSPDSSDVWANPELFLLDRERRPRFVGGVPPDVFSADGQLWGNPVYDWPEHERSGFRWWVDRVRALRSHVDLIRLDHFRGFAAAWHVVAGSSTARRGKWVAAPGRKLFTALQRNLGGLPLIAEDLGVITPDVDTLRKEFNIPGTRVLQFAFDGDQHNPHLPFHYDPNTVVYTAMHDNNTSRGWFESLATAQRQSLLKQFIPRRLASEEIARALIEMAWHSPAALAITPMQDLLNLGAEARMNVPGRVDGNWRWRCTNALLSTAPFQWLADLTCASGRSASPASCKLTYRKAHDTPLPVHARPRARRSNAVQAPPTGSCSRKAKGAV